MSPNKGGGSEVVCLRPAFSSSGAYGVRSLRASQSAGNAQAPNPISRSITRDPRARQINDSRPASALRDLLPACRKEGKFVARATARSPFLSLATAVTLGQIVTLANSRKGRLPNSDRHHTTHNAMPPQSSRPPHDTCPVVKTVVETLLNKSHNSRGYSVVLHKRIALPLCLDDDELSV